MKKATLQVVFPQEKLNALQHYAAEKDVKMGAELEDALQKMYEKYVPKEVRAYLEIMEQSAPPSRPRPNRPAPQAGASNAPGSQPATNRQEGNRNG